MLFSYAGHGLVLCSVYSWFSVMQCLSSSCYAGLVFIILVLCWLSVTQCLSYSCYAG